MCRTEFKLSVVNYLTILVTEQSDYYRNTLYNLLQFCLSSVCVLQSVDCTDLA